MGCTIVCGLAGAGAAAALQPHHYICKRETTLPDVGRDEASHITFSEVDVKVRRSGNCDGVHVVNEIT